MTKEIKVLDQDNKISILLLILMIIIEHHLLITKLYTFKRLTLTILQIKQLFQPPLDNLTYKIIPNK